MIDYSALYQSLSQTPLRPWLDTLPNQITRVFSDSPHGDLQRWLSILDRLPEVAVSETDLATALVTAGRSSDCNEAVRETVATLLDQLHPWRKGPYRVLGITIDSEWHSDWKWDRLRQHIQPLAGRLVLDVGCGNGYHCWRIAGAQARLTIGIDPSLLYTVQFHAIKHFIGNRSVYVLPLGVEDLPERLDGFDTLFSMGVFYHRRSPFDHLLELKDCLRDGGELVLETLVIAGEAGQVLVPEGRYAKMRNVWFIPSGTTLISWLRRCGFRKVRMVDETTTSVAEQRRTPWMRFQSLGDFLDADNPEFTVEGLPAPRRAIVLAEKDN